MAATAVAAVLGEQRDNLVGEVDRLRGAERLDGDRLLNTVMDVDIVLDGCDNFATRFQINDACVYTGKRLISGAAIRMEGQLAVFGPDYIEGPCYRCLFPEPPPPGLQSALRPS